MPSIIKSFDNRNLPVIDENNGVLCRTYFNIIHLAKGEKYSQKLDKFESVYVVLSGNCEITAGSVRFEDVGKRKDIWSGNADSVYVPVGEQVSILANKDNTEVAVAGGFCDKKFEPFRITPSEVDMVDVGSNETKSHRRIFHILGQKTKDRAGNLLVSELHADEGCWSGYPPHKHDSENGSEESEFEEAYHYRFNPSNGFGVQVVFQPDGSSECYMTQNGDTCLIDKGYHPTGWTPGHNGYIFTILVGKHRNSLIQNFKEDYRYIMDKIPGINDMRDKFK